MSHNHSPFRQEKVKIKIWSTITMQKLISKLYKSGFILLHIILINWLPFALINYAF